MRSGMMNSEIINPQFLNIETDINNYTATLLNSCAVNNLLSVTKMNDIKMQFTTEFLEYADRYTLRESSSIPVSTAEKITGSLMFCCDVFLLSYNSHKKAIHAIENMKIPEIIKNGQSLIWKYFNNVKIIHNQVIKTRVNLPIYIYNHSITECFDEFIKGYNFRYEAQNIPTLIDYPLLFETKRTQGILYIYEYYSVIKLENELCGYYESNEIDKLFQRLSHKFQQNCEDLFLNIAETILTNSLCAAALEKPIFSLSISREECDDLQEKIKLFAKQECQEMFKTALKQLCFAIKNPALIQYIRPYAEKLAGIVYELSLKLSLSGYLVIDTD